MKKDQTIQKFAIYGGTFDPVHYGHLLAAQEAVEFFGLDLVYFIPAFTPPHKDDRSLTVSDRVNMLKIAIQDNKHFSIDYREIESAKVNYTLDTVKSILEEYKLERIPMIIGEDSFVDFEQWYEWEKLLKITRLLVYPRLGVDSELQTIAKKYSKLGGQVSFFGRFFTDFSSSKIRHELCKGRNLQYIVPSGVLEYIAERGLYGVK